METVHRPNMLLAPHEHEHPALTLVREGAFALELDGEEYECDNRGVFFKLGECRHTNRFGPAGARSLVIELWPDHGAPYLERLPLPEHSFLARGGSAAALARELESEFYLGDVASGVALEGLLLELIAFMIRFTTKPVDREPGWMREALDILHDSFTTKVTLKDIADGVGIHSVHLARVFRRHQGCSVGEYVRRLRIQHASESLVESDASLVEIALAAGFFDQAHFCRSFKQRVGMTPSAYRQMARDRSA